MYICHYMSKGWGPGVGKLFYNVVCYHILSYAYLNIMYMHITLELIS
jgi:hypothetical protein